MRLVVDTRVAVKWLVEEDDLDAANCLLNDNNGLYAPRLMVSEVARAVAQDAAR